MSDLDIKQIINKCQSDGPRSEADIKSMLSNTDNVKTDINGEHTFGLNSNQYLTENYDSTNEKK